MKQPLALTLLALGLFACGARSALVTDPEASSPDARSNSDESLREDAGALTPPAPSAGATMAHETSAGLKIALLGDQGVTPEARRVLQLVVAEQADALVLLGDLAYDDGTSVDEWESQLDQELGPNFPVFAVIGNHDRPQWTAQGGYEARLVQRLSRMREAHCDGEYGVKSSCTYRGVSFIFSGIGTIGGGHEQYLESALLRSDATFRMCVWHKNQQDMQVGGKSDEVGWEAYRVCARHGVPILTGHEHSYARTQVLEAVGDREQGHGATGENTLLDLEPGRTFVVVSGLGGKSRRERTKEHEHDSWWAAVYAKGSQIKDGLLQSTDTQIEDGSLFLIFQGTTAHGYFKTVDGEIQDRFTWRAQQPTQTDLEAPP